MTTEEFNEKFKVGDKICLPSWEDDAYVIIDNVQWGIRQKKKDENLFQGTHEDGETITEWNKTLNWQLYEEPKEQDLKDVFFYFVINNYGYGKSFHLCFGDKEQFKNHEKVVMPHGSKVITIQEAQERGLDLSMFNLKTE
jgi:hypothetical protein